MFIVQSIIDKFFLLSAIKNIGVYLTSQKKLSKLTQYKISIYNF